MDLQELYQALIIDHGTEPRNCCALKNPTCSAEGFNPLCGDKVTVYLITEKMLIQSVSFEGQGCAISMASASLMTEALQNKTLNEALKIATDFKAVLTSDDEEKVTNTIANFEHSPKLQKLMALKGVKTFPARVKCATLAWHTLEAAIKKSPISTE